MANFSFIHCSDLHLGCQQFNNSVRWEDFGASFAYIVDFALEKKIDFMLIGGDLFHHRSINARTLSVAMELLGKLKGAGIKVFAIEGNHDKAFYLEEESWMGFLNDQGYIHLLKPAFERGRLVLAPYNGREGCMVEMEGLKIIGLGYLGATTRQRMEEAAAQLAGVSEDPVRSEAAENEAEAEAEAAAAAETEVETEVEAETELQQVSVYGLSESTDRKQPDDERPFTIVLLHAAVDKLLGQDLAGVGREVFAGFQGKVDYFALGHIHSRQELADFVYNPGAPECVHIDEVRKNQEKGFYYVKAQGKNREVTFCPSRRRSVYYFDVNLTGTRLPDEATDRIFDAIGSVGFEAGSRPIVQAVLHGMTAYSSFAIDTGLIAGQIMERYDCLVAEVINNINLVQGSENTVYSAFDREAVERLVISGLLEQEKPELSHVREELTGMIINLKNSLLSGSAGKDIIWAVDEMLNRIPGSKAAEKSANTEADPTGREGVSRVSRGTGTAGDNVSRGTGTVDTDTTSFGEEGTANED